MGTKNAEAVRTTAGPPAPTSETAIGFRGESARRNSAQTGR
ncbi:MAG: hypothetical protein ACLFVS_03600 [Candidatus Acetothermia bacterium]